VATYTIKIVSYDPAFSTIVPEMEPITSNPTKVFPNSSNGVFKEEISENLDGNFQVFDLDGRKGKKSSKQDTE